jgi:hypothetical protein
VASASSSYEPQPAPRHRVADAQRRAWLDELEEARRQLDEADANADANADADARHSTDGRRWTLPLWPCCCATARRQRPPRSDECANR